MLRRLLLVVLLLAPLAGCGDSGNGDDGRISVVAAFYPVAEAAQQVGGDLVHVRNLTPAGVEPHDLELTTDEIDRIQRADLVLYVGSGFQPAVANALKRRDRPSVDVAAGLITHKGDPHFWLDPDLMAKAVARVRVALAGVDRSHASAYKANAGAYASKLSTLSQEYASELASCVRHEIVTAHEAFAYLAERYGLTQTAISGVSPEAEPDPQRLAELSDRIKRDDVSTVFYEELVPRDFADTLAKDAGVKTAVLNPLEALTKKQVAAGDDYISVMRDNLVALTTALDCRPPTATSEP
jgi:zinc transport system substrate-binding protein